MKNITIYSTPACHFCRAAKEFFKKNSLTFTEYDVSLDKEKRAEMIEKSGQMGVPVIYIDDEMMVGFNESKLKELLSIA